MWIGPRPENKPAQEQELSQEHSFVESGTVTDNAINDILVDPVRRAPHCQLFALFDACMSGSILDLPMTLHDQDDVWMTSDWARRDEIFLGMRPMEWDCGEGNVFCISAAEDWKAAYDVKGGFLTHALMETELNRDVAESNYLTIGSLFADIRARVENFQTQFREACAARGMERPTRHHPVLSSSHFCSLHTPLFI